MQRLCHRLQHSSFTGAVSNHSVSHYVPPKSSYYTSNEKQMSSCILLQAVGQTESSNNDEECSVGALQLVQRKEPTSRFH